MRMYIALFLMLAANVSVAGGLCANDEVKVFSCEIDEKSVAVCRDREGKYAYLFGSPGKIELKLEKMPLLSTTSCAGGGISRLRFSSGQYSYYVYDSLCNAERIGEGQWSKQDDAGVMVVKGGKLLATLHCTGFSENVFGVYYSGHPDSAREEFDYDLTESP